MPSTYVEYTLVIGAGEVRTYTPEPNNPDVAAFYLISPRDYWVSQTNPERLILEPTLINYGSIIATNTATDNFGLAGVVNGSGTFWFDIVIENHGLISLSNAYDFARGIWASGWPTSVLNTGTISVTATTGEAFGIHSRGIDLPYGSFFQPYFIHNSATGKIIANGDFATAVLSLFANFTNDGLVQANSNSLGAVGLRSNGGYIENSGTIEAESNSGPAWGIALGLVDAFNGPRDTTLINTGRIEAEIAIDELYDGGVRTDILNTGVIVGDIILYDGDDTVRNEGQINGPITLGAGNDIYDGTDGALSGAVLGGDGDDVVNMSDHGGVADGQAGSDTLIADYGAQNGAVAYAASSGSSVLSVGGVAALTLSNFERVEIYGGGGYDLITGGAGNDVIGLGRGGGVGDGGAGADLVILDFSDRSASVLYTHNNTEATLTVGGVASAIVRQAESVAITGGAGADQVHGGAGNDVLAGGPGGDILDGGAGRDVVSYVSSIAGVSVTLGGAASGSDAAGDVLSGIEDLWGSAFADVLTGDANANVLDGGMGGDVLTGGAGADTYVVDHVGDSVIEAANEGADRVLSSISYTLGANLETLQLIGGASIHATGNGLNNAIIGNSGDNVILGGGGADAIDGGAGFDTLSYATSPGAVTVNRPWVRRRRRCGGRHVCLH